MAPVGCIFFMAKLTTLFIYPNFYCFFCLFFCFFSFCDMLRLPLFSFQCDCNRFFSEVRFCSKFTVIHVNWGEYMEFECDLQFLKLLFRH